jgi:phosphonate transport system permease protein
LGFAAIVAAALLFRQGFFDPARISRASGNLAIFTKDLFPPEWGSLPLLGAAMLETIEIAFLGTILGFGLSLPLAFFASRSLFGPAVSLTARFLVGGVRTVPSILWGVIFVVALGLGPAAGTVAVACYTVGYLAKLFYECFEGVDAEVVEATRGTGANRVQLFFFAVLPEAANTVLSQLLFMFEYNIRASTIMGFVGAGGIGYYMMGYIQMLQYRNLMTAVLLTFAVVMAIDRLSLIVRSRIGHIVSARN